MKILLMLSFIFISNTCLAQLKVSELNERSLPKDIKYNGKIVKAVRWADNTGDHIVVTTETGETASKGSEEDERDASLYAYHYIVRPDSSMLTWKLHDFIKNCSVDIKANFIKNSFAVTDLDNNGKAEVWLMYKIVCHGDVSPANMKIIMYEDDKKFAVRGTNMVKVSEHDHVGGEYSFDEAFKKGPEVFRKYAADLWRKNKLETWD